MDGLRQHAITLFSKRQRFDLSALSFDIIEIIKHAEGDTTFRHTSAFKDNLLDRVKDIPNYRNEQPRSRLQLVRIPRSQYNVLSIEQQLFSDLFALYRIEKYYLHSAGYETRGFQRFRSYTSGSGPDYIDSFFLDTTSALVLWSFDSSTKTTKVILVPSYATGIPDTTNVFEQFAQHLETHQNLVDTPFLVHLVSAIVIGSWLDIGIITAYQAMRQAEILTEHGVWRSYGRPPPELDELIRSSRDIGFTMTSLMNASRHVDIVRSLLAIDATTEEVAPMCLATKPGQSSDVRASTALKAIQNRVAMRKLDTEYLHERAKTQSSVVRSFDMEFLGKCVLKLIFMRRYSV